MNIIQIQDRLKGLPDDTLVNYIQNPTGQVPTYLALSEMQRRQEVRTKYEAQKQPEESVAEQLIKETMVPETQGIGTIAQADQTQAGSPSGLAMQVGMPQPEMTPEMMTEAGIGSLPVDNVGQEESYAGGGIVSFAEGALVGNADIFGLEGSSQYLRRKAYAVWNKDKREQLLAKAKEKEMEERALANKTDTESVYNSEANKADIARRALNLPELGPFVGPTQIEDPNQSFAAKARRALNIDPPLLKPDEVINNTTTSGDSVAPPEPGPYAPWDNVPVNTKKATINPNIDTLINDTENKPKKIKDYMEELKAAYKGAGVDDADYFKTQRQDIEKEKEGRTKDRTQDFWLNVAKAGLATASGTSQYAMENISKGLGVGLEGVIADKKEQKLEDKEDKKLQRLLDAEERATKRGDVKTAYELSIKAEDRASDMARTRMTVNASLKAALISAATSKETAQMGIDAKPNYDKFETIARQDKSYYKDAGNGKMIFDMQKSISSFEGYNSAKNIAPLLIKLYDRLSVATDPNELEDLTAQIKSLQGAMDKDLGINPQPKQDGFGQMTKRKANTP
jgi:hypothetical protein